VLASGQSTPGIAAALHISRSTTRNHLQNILTKLEVHSKAEALSYVFKHGLIGSSSL
jgi:DNA-binding NarL/FixJ family response regulator